MINVNSEELLSLRDAAKLLPSARSGKPVTFQCILRWALTGSLAPDGERVKLEAVRLGNRWVTSKEALQRFVIALTPPEKKALKRRTPRQVKTACEKASRELEKLGV
jgi:hypothetical protein